MPAMDGSARMWIGTIPAFDPDVREVILDIDHLSADPAELLVCVLLNRGHEGEEGVFHLLPEDLSARYERTGGRLRVRLLTHRGSLAADLGGHPESLREHLAGLPRDPFDDDRVVLLTREVPTDFVPAERDGHHQPVILIDHAGGPAAPAEPTALFERREAGVAVVAAPVPPSA